MNLSEAELSKQKNLTRTAAGVLLYFKKKKEFSNKLSHKSLTMKIKDDISETMLKRSRGSTLMKRHCDVNE